MDGRENANHRYANRIMNPFGYSGYVPDEEDIKTSLPIFLYPIVVRETRYGGVYEGGSWFAYSGYGFPVEAIGDDCECADFWGSEASNKLGVGNTPNEAVEHLVQIYLRLEEEKENDE